MGDISIAKGHFPQMVYRGGEKQLWNPILKKALKNRPEERVRLRVIEYLLQESVWSRHRISTEIPVEFKKDETPIRADILCYTQDFKPEILIECKAENIPIGGKVGEQIARYNTKIKAPYLLMTNGVSDYWYQIENGNISRLDQLPDIVQSETKPNERHFQYWSKRGFTGEKAHPLLRKWIVEVLNALWFEGQEMKHNIHYLTFKNSPLDLSLDHYYAVFQLNQDPSEKVALTTLATPYGGTRLIAIVNRDDENKGIIDINCDLLAADTHPNTTIYSAQGSENYDAKNHLSLDFQDFNESQLEGLPTDLLGWFKETAVVS